MSRSSPPHSGSVVLTLPFGDARLWIYFVAGCFLATAVPAGLPCAEDTAAESTGDDDIKVDEENLPSYSEVVGETETDVPDAHELDEITVDGIPSAGTGTEGQPAALGAKIEPVSELVKAVGTMIELVPTTESLPETEHLAELEVRNLAELSVDVSAEQTTYQADVAETASDVVVEEEPAATEDGELVPVAVGKVHFCNVYAAALNSAPNLLRYLCGTYAFF